ncbi:uncharacterized protein [Euphorbia lathyris]|uniref:uncharacterized protein n=1 Tax=Euphorbia lathyris TaxID=212925 RepID=UPI0033141560
MIICRHIASQTAVVPQLPSFPSSEVHVPYSSFSNPKNHKISLHKTLEQFQQFNHLNSSYKESQTQKLLSPKSSAEKEKKDPNEGNGMENHSRTQTLEELTISIQVPPGTNAEDEPQKSPKKIVPAQKKKIMGQLGEEELAAFQNLSQNAETILAVVQGNLPGTAEHGVTNPKSLQDSETDFARQQGDSLIACLGNIRSCFFHAIHCCLSV